MNLKDVCHGTYYVTYEMPLLCRICYAEFLDFFIPFTVVHGELAYQILCKYEFGDKHTEIPCTLLCVSLTFNSSCSARH